MGIKSRNLHPNTLARWHAQRQPWLVQGYPHATQAIMTQRAGATSGQIIFNGTGVWDPTGTDANVIMPIPAPLCMFFGTTTDTITATVTGLDHRGLRTTGTYTKGATGATLVGKTLWSKLESISVSAISVAGTFSMGWGYRASSSISGIVSIPTPFPLAANPRAGGSVAFENENCELKTIYILNAGGGAFSADANAAYLPEASTSATIIPSGGLTWIIPTTTTASTVSGCEASSVSGPSSQMVNILPNVTTPANVVSSPLYAMRFDFDAMDAAR